VPRREHSFNSATVESSGRLLGRSNPERSDSPRIVHEAVTCGPSQRDDISSTTSPDVVQETWSTSMYRLFRRIAIVLGPTTDNIRKQSILTLDAMVLHHLVQEIA
jgi:hypothetical protein